MELHDLPNIGKTLEQQLKAVGISSPEDLRKIGAKEAFIKLKAYDASSCFHKLTAVEGAVEGIQKKKLSPEKKAELKEFFNSL